MSRWILIPLLMTYWVIGFYPFQLDLPVYVENAATQKPDGALTFPGVGLARTPNPPNWLRRIAAGSAFHIALEIRSYNKSQSGPARIFTISEDPWHRNLTIAQEGTDLFIRCRRPGSSLNGTPHFAVEGVFVDEKWHRIVVKFEDAVLQVFVDGNEQVTATLGSRGLAGWNPTYRLAIGNELTGDRGWLGEIHSTVVQVDGKLQDYLQAGALEIPQGWWEIPERLSHLEEFELFSDITFRDVSINLLGFVPIGVILLLAMGARASLSVVFLYSCVLSLSIELGQLVIEERYPSVADFFFNVVGALVGFYAMRTYVGLRTRRLSFGVPPFRL